MRSFFVTLFTISTVLFSSVARAQTPINGNNAIAQAEAEKRTANIEKTSTIENAAVKYEQRIAVARERLLQFLQKELLSATQAGKLDLAIAIRERIKSLEHQKNNGKIVQQEKSPPPIDVNTLEKQRTDLKNRIAEAKRVSGQVEMKLVEAKLKAATAKPSPPAENDEQKIRELREMWLKKVDALQVELISLQKIVRNAEQDLAKFDNERQNIETLCFKAGVSFFGNNCESGVSNVVFVIDRSGSMLETFDFVKAELIRSINKLSPDQNFHVIFFAAGAPVENPPKQMVPATPANKQQLADFLRDVVPEGQTNPIQAMGRAFQVTNDQGEKTQLIYMLTDGEFPREAVSAIRRLNPNKQVKINTISFISDSGRPQLEAIAKESGGTYNTDFT